MNSFDWSDNGEVVLIGQIIGEAVLIGQIIVGAIVIGQIIAEKK